MKELKSLLQACDARAVEIKSVEREIAKLNAEEIELVEGGNADDERAVYALATAKARRDLAAAKVQRLIALQEQDEPRLVAEARAQSRVLCQAVKEYQAKVEDALLSALEPFWGNRETVKRFLRGQHCPVLDKIRKAHARVRFDLQRDVPAVEQVRQFVNAADLAGKQLNWG